ncbi:peptidase S8 [Micromonospora qiuiae]|uniref:Peptidase S8 n=1 Tax=Micromonospora qiuiae TaxID=502268 RepID=A0ABQ4J8A1_9ACTN|nr:S8 family serine peptidase [Micromonospora qiuiae]GIJ26365.1 peptidase S8 [Micromonospora qiuiae]
MLAIAVPAEPVRAEPTVSPATAWQRPASVGHAPAGDQQPPVLPQSREGCVGGSPMVAVDPPWPVRRTAPQAVWPLTRGQGVLVAVIDTGVSAEADALSGAVLPGTDVVSQGPGDRDCVGRGTALAGIVAARPVTGSGFVGLAPAARILPVRMVDGRGEVPAGALAAAVREATRADADVILLGVGAAQPDAALRAAVRDAVTSDIVVVASVSDAAPDPAPWYPATDENVLAVGGVDPDGTPTEALPPEAGVDLLAPSAGAVSVAPIGSGHYTVGGPAVAAAYVAGAAALVRAYHPQLNQAEVRRRLVLTAEPPLGDQQRSGPGTLDLYEAVSAVEIYEKPLPAGVPRMIKLPAPPPSDPAAAVAAAVAAGLVATAATAYVSAQVLRLGRRRRWRP